MNFLIKPVSGACNMQCQYCFYQDELSMRSEQSSARLSDELADKLIREAVAGSSGQQGMSFAFQGGEPTLAGLDFYRRFVEKVKQINIHHYPVQYGFQTNGLLLNGEWAEFFLENNFLVGISLDGTKEIHDSLRSDKAQKGTWNRAARNFAMLQKKGVEVNALCVVSRQIAKHPLQAYRNLQKMGARFIQFIPCLDPLDPGQGSFAYSLTPELYGNFLCQLFDAWYMDWRNGNYTSIRLFDDYVHLAMGRPPGTCATCGSCGAYMVIEGDGSVYPCDFFCLDSWKLGNLRDQSLTELCRCDTANTFLENSAKRPQECTECAYRRFCYGGCQRDRRTEGSGARNILCPAFRQFFGHAGARILEIARAEMQVNTFLKRQ